ncbi:amylosucrase [Treponema zioleckii]|uniref:amylosucrase n=1 Tax=Treponema zioleckii TaxID=331680 RepID=UPI00168AC292|nr:amylosucrase [Treponema zioleckii]
MYQKLLEQNMSELTARLYELYGRRWDFFQILSRLESIMKKASLERQEGYLLKNDEEALAASKENLPWYLKQETVGMMLYVDLFSENLRGLIEKIPYFLELGVNYVHLMPLFDCPKGENDGGYAISSYRKVQPKLGTIEDLRKVSEAFHKNGIRLVLDFVFNHTSDEHIWAKKAKRGDEKFKQFYYIYKDKAEVDSWNSTLREIFPTVRRGSFTYKKEFDGWVWTTFNSFQWDLNYSNPEVFLAMCEEMLFLANLGVDVLRLDALAFVWKEKGTPCESLSKAHTLIQAFQYVAKIACPSLQFKSEAIVHPDEVIKYINDSECRLSYNPLQMALFWSTVATRDARLLTSSLKNRWRIPENCAWINYIRCHDDIGWTFSDEDAAWLGINGYEHRKFLNRFFTGRFDGTFASGEPFQLNPSTGDCRICGTMASLAGLEQAEERNDENLRRMAIMRLKMMYAVQMALPGIPLLYAGDEKAVFNDYSYRNVKSKKDDSRWVHRIKTDWSEKNELASQKMVKDFVKKVIALRKNEPMLGGSEIFFYDVQDPKVFAFRRGTIHVVANFSDSPAEFMIDAWSENSTDLLTGRNFWNHQKQLLAPYEVRWLKEIIE